MTLSWPATSSHKAQSQIGIATKSNGRALTAVDWLANMAVDELAKSAARSVRVPESVLTKLDKAYEVATYWRTQLGEATFRSQNHTVSVLDPDGSLRTEVRRDSDGRPAGNVKHSEAAVDSDDDKANAMPEAPQTQVLPSPPPPPATAKPAAPADHGVLLKISKERRKMLALERRKAERRAQAFPEEQTTRGAPVERPRPKPSSMARPKVRSTNKDSRATPVLQATRKSHAHSSSQRAPPQPPASPPPSGPSRSLQVCDPLALCTAVQGISARDSGEQHARRKLVATQLCDTAAQFYTIHSDDEASTLPTINEASTTQLGNGKTQQHASRASFLQVLRSRINGGSAHRRPNSPPAVPVSSSCSHTEGLPNSSGRMLQPLRGSLSSAALGAPRNSLLPSVSTLRQLPAAAAAAPRGFSDAMWRLIRPPASSSSSAASRGSERGH